MKPDAFRRGLAPTANRLQPVPQIGNALPALVQQISQPNRGRVLVLVGPSADRNQLAHALARQLAYRIDVAGGVSKYIGETEKNLSSVFDRANRLEQQQAAVGVNRVERADGSNEQLGHIGQVDMAVGDVFVIETPGGGGYGRAN